MKLCIAKTLKKAKRWTAPTGRKGALKLDLNESNDILDREFVRKLREFDPEVITSYPEYDALLSQLASYAKQPTKNIVITNGADQGINLVLRLLFDQKSTVVLPSPVFSMYEHDLALIGSKVAYVSHIDRKDRFEFPTKEVASTPIFGHFFSI